MESALKLMRIVWLAMLLASFLYVWIPEQAHVQPRELSSTFLTAFLVLGVVTLTGVVAVRKVLIGRAVAMLQSDPNDSAAVAKWKQGQIITVALCESIVLYGLVLRFAGATRVEAAPLYVLGIAAMIVFWPRRM